MNQQKIIEIIANIIQKDPSSISPQHSLRGDLGMDSMQALELMVILEEDYQIMVPQEKMGEIKTPEQLWNAISGHDRVVSQKLQELV